MPSQAQRLIFQLRIIILVAIAALLITSAPPASAQNSVPPTARQAATTPQFASRLAHPAGSASPSNPAGARRRSRTGPQQNGEVYDNGPINGTVDAWTINSGFVTSNTITVAGSGNVGAMTFGAWLFPGDVLESVEVSITSSEFGGTTYFDGVVAFTQSNCSGNQYGFNVCTATSANFNGPNLAGGTYWVNLSNAVVNTGDPVYWDENSGVGCESEGCPSLASENLVGTIPSEAFTVLGDEGPPTCFESQGNLQIIHDFTQQQTGGTNYTQGVTIDRAGNLYGTTAAGGDNSDGLAFKLSHFGAGWIFDPLFSFVGGYNGFNPGGVLVGPNGSLYGDLEGGIQNCGSDGNQYCGLVYNLTPQPTVCRTSLCGWNENALYRFTSNSDGFGMYGVDVSAFDQEGNLYGSTPSGGAFGEGTVFELTRSGGGWTKTTLYNFNGNNDGGPPGQVLVGHDGNLYGLGSGGSGVVFELTFSGGQWTESVLHAFNGTDGSSPSNLVQDSAGNLYGIANSQNLEYGLLFTLQRNGSGWNFSEQAVQHSCMPEDIPYEYLNNLTIDAGGNLYGTGTGGERFRGRVGKDSDNQACSYNYIFQASYNGAWHYQDLDFLLNTYFPAFGGLALDTSGNLYGTTLYCGANGDGTVWQYSP